MTKDEPTYRVIADKELLSNLVAKERTELLPRLYGSVLVPKAVIDAMKFDSRDSVKAWASNPPRLGGDCRA
jgi:hypothetical protein